jgi:hypothetical protein
LKNKKTNIPNVIHFIFGLQSPRPLAFMHYLAIKSAYDCNRPDAIKFYYKYEPTGEWWEKSKPYLTLVKVEPPTEIFGNKISHYAHQADVIRLEVLMKEGGIYLDMDVVCFNSFKPLLKHDCVMGKEGLGCLCNAVILARPNARFIEKWYDRYHSFDSNKWNEHSCQLPFKLALENPKDIYRVDRFAFFWPLWGNPETLWDEPDQRKTLKSRIKYKMEKIILNQSYCVHLWNHLWWDKYLSCLSPEYIRSSQNIFSKLCKKFLDPVCCEKEIQTNKYRFLLSIFIGLISLRTQFLQIIKRSSGTRV